MLSSVLSELNTRNGRPLVSNWPLRYSHQPLSLRLVVDLLMIALAQTTTLLGRTHFWSRFPVSMGNHELLEEFGR